MSDSGRLILAATPLGNSDDASLRLRHALATADVIAGEDTRRVRRLLHDVEVAPTGRIVSYFDGNENHRAPELLESIKQGNTVLVISDAGMPSISDPGYRITVAAIDAGYDIDVLPGPSAVTTALVLSGLPCHRFCFEGFLPRTSQSLRTVVQELATEQRTMVFFESPRRIGQTLSIMADGWSEDRPAAVCRELTKTYQEVKRGTLAELALWAHDGLLGEITLVIQGATADSTPINEMELQVRVELLVRTGFSKKDAIAQVSRDLGLSRRLVYETIVHS